MRLKEAVVEARRAFVMTMLTENPRASFASLQRALKEQFGHAMQQGLLRGYVDEFTQTLQSPAVVTVPAGTEVVLDEVSTAQVTE